MTWIGRSIAKIMCNRPVRISDYEIVDHEKEFYYTVSCLLRMPNGDVVKESADLTGRPFSTIDVPAYELNRRMKEKYHNVVL